MRNSFSKLVLSAVAVSFAVGCSCEPDVAVPRGVLAVAYPSPTDKNTEVSSEATESKAAYTFDSVFMGQTATLPMKIQNNGRGTLALANIEIVEGADVVTIGEVVKAPNPVFEIAFVPETAVEAGGTQEIIVTFKPEQLTNVLSKKYTAIIKLNATNATTETATVEITLTGTGVSGVCELPKIIDFGAVARNDTATETVALRNPTQLEATAFVGDVFGSDAPAFTYASDSARGSVTLPPGVDKPVKVNFTPTEVRSYFAFTKMRASAQCPEVTVTLQGSGVDAVLSWYWVKPDGSKDYTKVDFGYASPGLEVRRVITFENASNSPVNLSQLKFGIPTEFKVIVEAGNPDPTKLVVPRAVGGVASTVTLPVAVKPAVLGVRQTDLNFNTNLPKQPTGRFTARAFGGGPDIQLTPASTLSFGKVAYFPSAAPGTVFTKRRITIQNVGTAPVPPDNNGNLHVDGANITLAPVPGTPDTSEVSVALVGQDPVKGLVAKLGENTAYLEVTITPTSVGPKSWEVSIPSNDPDEPVLKVIISADIQELAPCTLTVSPGNVNFGLVSPPSYRDLTVNIKNTGQELCIINNLGLKAGSHATFELPAGPIDNQELLTGEQMSVTVRAFPKTAVTNTLQTVTGNIEFFYNSNVTPQKIIPLTAGIATGCLTIAPPDLDFGTVQQNCASAERPVTVYNSCGTTVRIDSINILDGSVVPNGQSGCTNASGCPEFSMGSVNPSVPTAGLPMPQGGSPLTFRARYAPKNLGADQGTIALSANQNGQNVTYIITLNGRGDTVGQNVDVFSQDTKPKADILICNDSSPTMEPKQLEMGTNFNSFLQYAQASGVDWQIGMVLEDDDVPNQYAPYEQGQLTNFFNEGLILTPTTPNVEAKFASKVKVIAGMNGSATGGGQEQCLLTTLKAVTAPLITGKNAGFLRADASLSIVVMTDEPDQSTYPATYYLSSFLAVKGSKAANSFTFNVIGPFPDRPNTTPGCYITTNDNGKYMYMVKNTTGVYAGICEANWAVTLQDIGKRAFGHRTEFFLNSNPDLTGGKTIEVKIDGVVIPTTDSRGAAIWTFDPVSNSVNFEPSYVPEAGQTMTISYFVTCFTP